MTIQTTKAATSTSNDSEEKKNPNSLEIKDLRVGNGPEAKLGKTVIDLHKTVSFEPFDTIIGCCLLHRSIEE